MTFYRIRNTTPCCTSTFIGASMGSNGIRYVLYSIYIYDKACIFKTVLSSSLGGELYLSTNIGVLKRCMLTLNWPTSNSFGINDVMILNSCLVHEKIMTGFKLKAAEWTGSNRKYKCWWTKTETYVVGFIWNPTSS